jgi:multiple sugar transport system permease protein
MMAAALICALPVVLLYFLFQRYLVGGLTAGGVK